MQKYENKQKIKKLFLSPELQTKPLWCFRDRTGWYGTIAAHSKLKSFSAVAAVCQNVPSKCPLASKLTDRNGDEGNCPNPLKTTTTARASLGC